MQNLNQENFNAKMKAIIASHRQRSNKADDALIDFTLDLLKSMNLIALPDRANTADEGVTPLPKAKDTTPAVAVEESVQLGFLICLEDGKPLKMLKRHLKNKYGLTPDEYRQKWNLPADYPMVAPA